MFLAWNKDIRHDPGWFGRLYNDSSGLMIRINEPLLEKVRSFKAEGYVEAIIKNGKAIPARGKLFVYFSKDPSVHMLKYGDMVLVNKPVQKIRNSGNPGAFNYERYAAFQQTFHSLYLAKNEWVLLPHKNISLLKKAIFNMRAYVLHALQKYIAGDKNVLGIAEALLIGYKEDLDKDLVQAYSNAGVVHIIAISGLHLGLIYIMLVWLFNRLPFIKNLPVVKVVLILACLWLFSLLTGASASVLRSAVMFTCIITGKHFFKQASIYNSLAVSAFILLSYDPYFLWDVGFQLSYLAVIGIVSLQQPILHLLYVKNKWLNKIWNMIAITFAAQLATFPLCIYYFHQFPNLFFITNLLAVPLSTLILFTEIFLVAFSWLPIAAIYTGKISAALIWLMNFMIRSCNDLPFSVMDNIYATVITTWLLYVLITCICGWLLYKNKMLFYYALAGLFVFTCFQVQRKLQIRQQKKIIIYNIPHQQAIDFVYQRRYHFLGDSIVRNDGLLKSFHLRPARISLQVDDPTGLIQQLYHKNKTWQFFNKKLVLVDSSIAYMPLPARVKTDLLVISKNPTLRIADLTVALEPSLIVFDASNSLWKIAKWKRECEGLALPCFSVPEQGAFILNIE
jgi:competence protein ComEC